MHPRHSLRRVSGLAAALVLGVSLSAVAAQPAARSPAVAAPAATPARPIKVAPVGKIAPTADLRQLMRGVFFPESNVIFAAQDDPSTFKQAEDAAVSPNPLTSIYGGWESVRDASQALEDATNLLLLPGRLCSNGKPVPLQRADWAGYVQILREAAAASDRAAQARSQDDIVQVSDTLTRACDACHAAYRDKYKNTGNTRVCEP